MSFYHNVLVHPAIAGLLLELPPMDDPWGGEAVHWASWLSEE